MHWMKYILLAVGTTDISVIATEFAFPIFYVLSKMVIESMMR